MTLNSHLDLRTGDREPLSASTLPRGCALEQLGIGLTEVGDRYAVTLTVVNAQHLNQNGRVQGGIFSVIADATAGWAAEAYLGGDHYVTTSLSGQLLGSVSVGERIRTVAEVVHGGRKVVYVTARLSIQNNSQTGKSVAIFGCQQLVVS